MTDRLKLGIEDGRDRDGRSNLNYYHRELRRNNRKIKSNQPTDRQGKATGTLLAQTIEGTQHQQDCQSNWKTSRDITRMVVGKLRR